jgi:hypothetical protein
MPVAAGTPAALKTFHRTLLNGRPPETGR